MCGVIGLWGNDHVVRDLYQGLLAIQHRGQDSAGIVTYDGRFHTVKGNGLVRDLFTPEAIARLTGDVGLGHTRYPTVGSGTGEDAQPFEVNSPFGIVMAHNGNVTNYKALKADLFDRHRRLLSSDCDVEAILNIFAVELARTGARELTPEHVFQAVAAVYRVVRGSYAVVAYIAGQGLLAFRDPHGIKPLSYGVRRGGLRPAYAFASETVSLNIMGFDDILDVKPGQAVFIDRARKVHTRQLARGPHTPCLFEWVYFARPDSFIDKANVYKVRVHLGNYLADEIRRRRLKIDVVVPVPDSARDAAIEIARKLDLKYSEALVKNRYIGRTFIMPADDARKSSIRLKLNPIASEVRNKNVLLVDDSIVRGNTSRAIVEMVRECGARKVFFAAYSPPLRFPCVYGIDMQTAREFVARDADESLVAKRIGADEVIYQTLANLKRAVAKENPKLTRFCAACFNGIYPTGDVSAEVLRSIECDRQDHQEAQLELDI